MPVSNRIFVLVAYLERVRTNLTKFRGYSVGSDGELRLKDTTTREVFPIPVADFVAKVQTVKDRRISRINHQNSSMLGDPDRWDDTDLDLLVELNGPNWAHVPRLKMYQASIMVRKRGLLKKLNGGYRGIVRGKSSNGR